MSEFENPYGFATPALSAQGFQDDYRRDSVTTDGSVLTYSSGHSPIEPTSFDNAVTPEDTTINHNDIFNCTMDGNFTTAFQQPTPALSTGFDNFDILSYPLNPLDTNVATGLPHLSPGAQPDVTLYSPQMQIDEGFGEGMPAFDRPTSDFTLFDTTQPNAMNLNATTGFFPDINQFGGQFDHSLYTDPNMSNAYDDLMVPSFSDMQ
jgi:hypothetical protein